MTPRLVSELVEDSQDTHVLRPSHVLSEWMARSRVKRVALSAQLLWCRQFSKIWLFDNFCLAFLKRKNYTLAL